MFKKNQSLNIKIIIILAFFILFGFVLCSLFFYKSNIAQKQLEQKITIGIPLRIKIPNINLDASIEQVGITKEGLMGVPEGPNNTAWYNLGKIPGEKGTAVIDGRSGWKDGIPAVFDNLHKINKGDKIYIENQTGKTVIFIVREIKKYNPKIPAKEVFYSDDNKSHLNLITCEGLWDENTKSRSERLVIFSDQVLI